MKAMLLIVLLLAPLAALLGVAPLATYCNHLSIPNFPVGFFAREVKNGQSDAGVAEFTVFCKTIIN